MKKKVDKVYYVFIDTLKKYSEDKKHIPIARARYAISFIHRFHRPYNTAILNNMINLKLIKMNGAKGHIEILA